MRLGNWLTAEEGRRLLQAPDPQTLKGKRDRAILAVLRDGADPTALAQQGRLVLYGDLDLVAAAADIFRIGQ